jgi:hypothetical protein
VVLASLAIFVPRLIALPFAAIAMLAAAIVLLRAWRLRMNSRASGQDAPPSA